MLEPASKLQQPRQPPWHSSPSCRLQQCLKHAPHAGLLRPQHVLPALVHVLVPAMRPVAAHLQTDAERAALAELVDTMLAYNLCYEGGGGVAAAAAAGVSTALQPLQPPVDRLCNLEVWASAFGSPPALRLLALSEADVRLRPRVVLKASRDG